MARTTKTITFSLPPDLSDRVDEAATLHERSRSEFVRAALLRYLKECEWGELLRYGELTSRQAGISSDEVVPLGEAYRVEAAGSSRA